MLTTHVGFCFQSDAMRKLKICNALKDREFVNWLCQKTTIFEDLAFSNKINKETFNFIYNFWKKENRNLTPPP